VQHDARVERDQPIRGGEQRVDVDLLDRPLLHHELAEAHEEPLDRGEVHRPPAWNVELRVAPPLRGSIRVRVDVWTGSIIRSTSASQHGATRATTTMKTASTSAGVTMRTPTERCRPRRSRSCSLTSRARGEIAEWDDAQFAEVLE
jgi:hypothetical protein